MVLGVVALIVAGATTYAIVTHDDGQPESTQSPGTSREQPATDQQPPADNSDGAAETNVISKDKAEQIALDEFGGTIKETESDDYKGTPAWEVEVRDSREGRIEVKVDKQTGEILHWEHDD